MAPNAAVLISVTAALLLRPVAAQTQCGGNLYTPGTLNFTLECYNAFMDCAAQFEANASQVDCNDGKGNLFMQQQANLGASPGSQNNDAVIAFQDIRDLCLLGGSTTATWGYSDNQWYWAAAEDACYTSDPSRTDVVKTQPAPYCIQNRDSALPECYPQPDATPAGGPLKVIKTAKTRNGFTSSARGWNTYGVQALANGSQVVPSFAGQSGLFYTQKFVETQCGVLARPEFKKAGYDLCSLDSGWQATNAVDDHGRIIYNTTRFNLPELALWLHKRDLKLGVYITPGVPCLAHNQTILGTKIKIKDVLNGNNDQVNCDFDFSKDGVQQWHDSVVAQWASWGVDMLKLDFLTPGSPSNGANLACDSSDAVRAYQKAIKKSGRKIRLDISWKLCRNETWLPIWSDLAESMRTDQDLDNYGTNTLMAWQVGQRAIENYRQYIGLQAQRNVPLTIYPDMDALFTVNPEHLAGVNDTIRYTVQNHWLGAGANLIIGGDMQQVDALGLKLTTSKQSIDAADFFAKYPMQPRNPGTGSNAAKQLQAWIGGPSDDHEAYVLIVNYGPDLGNGGFSTQLYGKQKLTVSLKDLGISGSAWTFTDIWSGKSTRVTGSYSAWLTEGESQLLRLTRTR
ncbi:glycoside hydrolase family 27 protein [Trichoderma citrinoviride]|uniref:alpha-galactosidase n=1 Tax=Trichoderma citrinoviride TaxID=58853 RepID=A0A2T4B1T9_9HYPO|nr:glycoside hydrolase family 27 protein [Trichoderma citrinoviride]PTB63289.1 glycoside hydrolase family 27 protein [Trichoderma citrinoviride]